MFRQLRMMKVLDVRCFAIVKDRRMMPSCAFVLHAVERKIGGH